MADGVYFDNTSICQYLTSGSVSTDSERSNFVVSWMCCVMSNTSPSMSAFWVKCRLCALSWPCLWTKSASRRDTVTYRPTLAVSCGTITMSLWVPLSPAEIGKWFARMPDTRSIRLLCKRLPASIKGTRSLRIAELIDSPRCRLMKVSSHMSHVFRIDLTVKATPCRTATYRVFKVLVLADVHQPGSSCQDEYNT